MRSLTRALSLSHALSHTCSLTHALSRALSDGPLLLAPVMDDANKVYLVVSLDNSADDADRNPDYPFDSSDKRHFKAECERSLRLQ